MLIQFNDNEDLVMMTDSGVCAYIKGEKESAYANWEAIPEDVTEKLVTLYEEIANKVLEAQTLIIEASTTPMPPLSFSGVECAQPDA